MNQNKVGELDNGDEENKYDRKRLGTCISA